MPPAATDARSAALKAFFICGFISAPRPNRLSEERQLGAWRQVSLSGVASFLTLWLKKVVEVTCRYSGRGSCHGGVMGANRKWRKSVVFDTQVATNPTSAL
jgi:hypothetical protein